MRAMCSSRDTWCCCCAGSVVERRAVEYRALSAEHGRIADADGRAPDGDWKHWGTYLAERAWGTVREDYSATGDAWGFVTHDHARMRAYRWNEVHGTLVVAAIAFEWGDVSVWVHVCVHLCGFVRMRVRVGGVGGGGGAHS
jgi:hypothetical protein